MIILSATTYDDEATVTGEKFKGDGYYGSNDGLHTVAYHLLNFVGIIKMQATLASNPTANDWFDVAGTTVGDGSTVVTQNTFKNFTGNFVWVRGRVSEFTQGVMNGISINR